MEVSCSLILVYWRSKYRNNFFFNGEITILKRFPRSSMLDFIFCEIEKNTIKKKKKKVTFQ